MKKLIICFVFLLMFSFNTVSAVTIFDQQFTEEQYNNCINVTKESINDYFETNPTTPENKLIHFNEFIAQRKLLCAKMRAQIDARNKTTTTKKSTSTTTLPTGKTSIETPIQNQQEDQVLSILQNQLNSQNEILDTRIVNLETRTQRIENSLNNILKYLLAEASVVFILAVMYVIMRRKTY